MSIGLVFWIIMLILILFTAAVFGGLMHPLYGGGNISSVVEIVLFVLLGWKVFGPMVHS